MNIENLNFGKHPSKILQECFSQKPFQMQAPEKAKIIFLSLDATWDKDIENNKPYFAETVKYLKDGITYWQSTGLHHPMLKDTYTGDGSRFHRQFKKLGLSCDNAQDICFLELLNVCTYGISSKDKDEYKKLLCSESNSEHLMRISKIANDKDKLVYIGGSNVKRYIQELKLFDIYAENIIVGEHFSNAITNEYLYEMGQALKLFLITGKLGILPKKMIESKKTLYTNNQHNKKSFSKKDYTKYLFNKKIYGKGRLVHAVVSHYIQQHQPISFKKLQDTFPDCIQYDKFMNQKFGVIQLESQIHNLRWERHFYLKSDEIIEQPVSQERIAVCKEWGKGNIDKFINHAATLGIEIKHIIK